jgi:hypothetical protein
MGTGGKAGTGPILPFFTVTLISELRHNYNNMKFPDIVTKMLFRTKQTLQISRKSSENDQHVLIKLLQCMLKNSFLGTIVMTFQKHLKQLPQNNEALWN